MTAPELSIVIPTITGREKSLGRCVRAYEATLGTVDAEILVVKDELYWPGGCNAGYARSRSPIVHFSADDLEPLPGWWTDVLPALEAADELPAARVMNHSPGGVFDNAGDGPDGSLVHFTRIPIMTRSQYERIGPWPSIPYAADVWLSEKGRALGIETRMFHSYAFVHHWEQHGRIDTPENLAASEAALNELRLAYA